MAAFLGVKNILGQAAVECWDNAPAVQNQKNNAVNISRESKVGSNTLEWCPHLMSEKTENNKNCHSCHQGLLHVYLEINIADCRKVFACTVTNVGQK